MNVPSLFGLDLVRRHSNNITSNRGTTIVWTSTEITATKGVVSDLVPDLVTEATIAIKLIMTLNSTTRLPRIVRTICRKRC